MAEPQISLDPQSLSPVEEKLRGALESQLSSALQAASVKIKHEYAGQNADQVTQMLFEGTKAGLHPDIAAGFHPDYYELRHVAEAIVEGR